MRENTHQMALESIVTPRQAKMLTRSTPTHSRRLKRCFNGTATRSHAIKTMCVECCGGEIGVATECGDECCPLWRFRPGQKLPSKSKGNPNFAKARKL